MRMPALILIVVAAILPMAPASPQDKVNPARKEQIDESAKKIKELHKERIATLKEMADQIDALFKNRMQSFGDVCEAKLLVLNAELDAAEKESDRIALYKAFVDVMKEYEAVAVAQAQNGRGTAAIVLKIKARRLETEIHLEQAKVKEAKERK